MAAMAMTIVILDFMSDLLNVAPPLHPVRYSTGRGRAHVARVPRRR
jgi:hypothetical protein